ncbi:MULTISPECIES: LacI family DNA-binding transcriptional regulator [unclassified Oceanispirochaeta]|uniref:LacI family DNA-binding transcriptional regulator n=1 Tax=unclassified Oceanispirochaeta TaxID=2635722 RepID=UPI000E09721B|nr:MULTISPECIES: LacI family DNA-binding transcriptional regulator [unclassified Oceanispirochaeta]MBF9018921.1 LacI family DNA-binding transcriptional regulator [Oceanispirochaeta sp. M2]NPD75420.1 LacI family transcriptional regulator [Oceanispirochaeta sp. M1]RDG28720.1 LacI family transcriptional regulator [Oceanispirochaeta sp. M1]
MVRLEDVADDSGFSRATVSRVINDENCVKPQTVKKIRESMEKLGYKPNMVARALSSGRKNAVAVLLPDDIAHYYTDLLRGVSDVSQDAYYHTIVKSISKMNLAEDLISSNMVDGFIIRHSRSFEKFDDLMKKIRENDLPVIFIGKPFHDSKSPSVVVDNVGGARKLAHLFAENNFKKILFISGSSDNIDSNDRKYGFEMGLSEYGFDMNNLVEVEGDFSKENGYQIAVEYLGGKDFDAVFAANDRSAIGVLYFLNEQGIKVPEEVSVAGFDDAFFAEYLWPSLTTVRQPMYEIGMTAMHNLLMMIDKNPAVTNEVILPTELIIRQSCKV